ncbi:MAG: hypothetical protein ACFFDB_19370 [Promethearchaeota archaeon]
MSFKKKDPDKVKKQIDKISLKIEKKGWTPALGNKLGWAFFDIADIDEAEKEFYKYLDTTKKQDVPGFIFMKWLAENAESARLMANQPGIPGQVLASFSREEMLEMYEEGKKNYLKNFQD